VFARVCAATVDHDMVYLPSWGKRSSATRSRPGRRIARMAGIRVGSTSLEFERVASTTRPPSSRLPSILRAMNAFDGPH